MNDREIFILSGFIEIGSRRQAIFNVLSSDDVKIPKRIAEDSGVKIGHVSNTLREFKKKGLAECINEEDSKGRLYRLTPLGNEVKQYLEKRKQLYKY